MMLLLLLISINSHTNQVDVLYSGNNRTEIRVEFSEENNILNRPITRFIIAQEQPRLTYTLSKGYTQTAVKYDIITNHQPVQVHEPISMGSQNIYPITIWPNFLKADIIQSYKYIDISVDFVSYQKNISLSPSMQKVYRHLILNLATIEDAEPQGYLIITPDALYNDVLPLARWKEKKGWYVSVKMLSETGSSPTEIKNYIANAYHTWSPTPEYVLLIGDTPLLPPASTTVPVSRTDYPYTLIDGNDFLAELLIGRLPANNTNELNTMIAKIIGYEQTPYMNDPAWFTRALMVAANYPLDTMTTPIATKRWVRDRLYDYGFATIDTVYYPPVSGPSEIANSVNQGVLFVNYRGGIADPDGWVYPNFSQH